MASRRIFDEAEETLKAAELIRLGARMHVLESEFPFPRDRLIRLYREIRGVAPQKGMIPSSPDWFVPSMPNIHASLFGNVFFALKRNSALSRPELLSRAYRLYQEHFESTGHEVLMDLTRAWTLLRFLDGGVLQLVPCRHCKGHYIAHSHKQDRAQECWLCQPIMPALWARAQKAA